MARLLSGHFLALAQCIEREHGRIDKIMGDGLIAVWALPRPAADRAGRPCGAGDPVGGRGRQCGHVPGAASRRSALRVGLHAGPLIAAPLGAAGRLGVALCGDTVNVAQRLEDAGRGVAANGAVTIVASDTVVTRAGSGFRFAAVGRAAGTGPQRAGARVRVEGAQVRSSRAPRRTA